MPKIMSFGPLGLFILKMVPQIIKNQNFQKSLNYFAVLA